MLARKITLSNFRNIESATVSFHEGVNVLYGDNAQGKTNLLEALYYASIGKSFRGVHTAELLRFGATESHISFDFKAGEREQNLSFVLGNRVRSVFKNRVRLSKMSEMMGTFRAVLFCPEHLSLIKEGPAARRQFLDIAISAANPLYLGALQRYHHVLKQRNALIKSAENDEKTVKNTIDIWSRQLADEGALISAYRYQYVQNAAEHVKNCFTEMTGERENPTLVYQGIWGREKDGYLDNDKTAELLYHKLTENVAREIAAGMTLYGIQKDDVDVLLNDKSARLYCSQGQQRSLALALKIAEGELCFADCGEYPVLLFDDVLSELDKNRREYLLSHIKGKQVIMTTCEKEGVLAEHLILVKNGTFCEV